jgi:chromosome partitioning protein
VQIISFINMKGGVGKTTLAVNVAYGLAYLHGKKVLIVDSDPQFNATQYLLEDDVYLDHLKDDQRGTLYDIFFPKRPGVLRTVAGPGQPVNRRRMALNACTLPIFNGGAGRGKLDLIPSTLNLFEIEMSRRGTESRLKAYLNEKATGYDYVIIDCPPTVSIFTQAAILASHKYLVPVKPDPLSVIGLPLLERWLEEYTEENGVDIEPVGLVFTIVRGPTPRRMREVMEELRAERGDSVFTDYLSEATAVSEAVEHRQPIFLYGRGSKTANQMTSIVKEFVDRTSGD